LPGVGASQAVSNGPAGFAFNSDAAIPKRFPTKAQWDEAAHMTSEMEEALCERATAEACPI